jgi:hypothetical protein
MFGSKVWRVGVLLTLATGCGGDSGNDGAAGSDDGNDAVDEAGDTVACLSTDDDGAPQRCLETDLSKLGANYRQDAIDGNRKACEGEFIERCPITDKLVGSCRHAGGASYFYLEPDAGKELRWQLEWQCAQLGTAFELAEGFEPTPELVPLEDVVAISVRAENRCALRGDGSVWCWGVDAGVLGLGETESAWRYWAQRVPELSGATAIQVRDVGYCALQAGSLTCWGGGSDNGVNVLFGKPTRGRALPTVVDGLGEVVAFTLGESNYALSRAGTIWRWSDKTPKELSTLTNVASLAGADVALLGDGSAAIIDDAKPIPGIKDATVLTSDATNLCVLVGGDVLCGRRPVPALNQTAMLTRVALPTAATSLSPTMDGANCAVLSNQEGWCWGGFAVQGGTAPRKVLDDVKSLQGDLNSGCGVTSDGKVRCWGINTNGERGSMTTRNEAPSLVLVPASND